MYCEEYVHASHTSVRVDHGVILVARCLKTCVEITQREDHELIAIQRDERKFIFRLETTGALARKFTCATKELAHVLSVQRRRSWRRLSKCCRESCRGWKRKSRNSETSRRCVGGLTAALLHDRFRDFRGRPQ
jgi:hypothetical protein